MSLKLGVNIDHVATLRQARYRGLLSHPLAEPCLLEAALAVQQAGAQGITVHLREDRRHIQVEDVFELKAGIALPLNLEMGNTEEILSIALRLLPQEVCLVPECREELTTEGGLDCVTQEKELLESIRRLQGCGIQVSLFVDPDLSQIEAAARLQADHVELHTGSFANAVGNLTLLDQEWERLYQSALLAHALGLQVHAGHGINYHNIVRIVALPHLTGLNIGHAILSRALAVGIKEATREMLMRMGSGGMSATS